MVVKKHVILDLLKELDTVLEELSKHRHVSEHDLAGSLSLRWTVERGLIAAANLVFDALNHILAAAYGVYSETYEDTLVRAHHEAVLSDALFARMAGLGGFRNVLVHEYVRVDIRVLRENLSKGFDVFPAFSAEIQRWLALQPD